MGALMHTIGLPEKEPLRVGGNAAGGFDHRAGHLVSMRP
jgi:hypothetical protein